MKKKSGRRILSLLMAVILVIGTLQVPGLTLKVRADTVESGTCGNGVTYVLDSDGVLTISKTDQGTGEITDKPWVTAHRDDVKKLVIEDGVINLPDSFFGHFFELTSVSIAGSVKKIEAYCFQGCYKLGELILSEGLESIDEYAFDGCKELESVTIPKSVSKLEGNAFEGCDKLKAINVTGGNQNYHSVDGVVYNSGYTCLIKYPSAKEGGSYVIPDTVTEIGAYAFYGCSALTDLTIPASVTAIGAFAFAECSALKDITIPASVTDIGRCAFVHCDTLTSITMSVIGDFCFMECSALTSVVINDGVKEISYGAFRYCPSLAAISIPKSITKIQDNAFEGCNANAVITYPGSPGEWSKIDISDDTYWGQITLNCTGGEIVESDECGNGVSYDLDSNGILYISGTGAVTNHPWKDNDIRKVLIGKGVTDVTAAGFINCSYLEDISVKNGNKVYSSEDGVLFNKNKTELIQYHCNKDVDEYTVPDAVTTIKGMAFAGCSALKSIAFSDSVISIEEDAFKNCSSLTDVYYGGAGTKWDTLKNNNIGANNSSLTNAKIHYMKGSCGSNAAWTLTKDGVLTISGTGEIEEVNGDSWKVVDVKEVVIGNGVTAIGDGVFGACCMTSVTIPENVTSVGEFGFAGCDTLEEVTFLGNEVTIEEYAFGECFSLKKITIPKKVVVGESAFESCTGLRDVYYGGTEEDWNKIIIDGTINGNGNDLLISANIHYTVFVTGVSVEPTMLELRVGESGTLTATVVSENATNKNVSWTSSAPDVATVTDGVVTAVGEGETDITVTTEDGGKTATCKVTVAGFAVTGVSITPETLSLKVGESGTLTAAVVPENATNKNVSWTSSAPDVATVTDGVVTAVAEGETDITVTTEDGAKTATCRVTVAGFAVTGVSIAPETLSLKVGESGTLTAAVAPENATNKNVSWTSSAPAVVTVADGVVTAVSEGETDITVTTEDGGKTATCRVTVTKKAESTDPADPTEPDKPAEPEKPVEPEIPEGPLGPEKPDLSRYTASGNEIAVKSINLKKTVFKDVKGIKKFNVTAGDASAYKIKGSTLTVLKDATVTIEALNKKKEKLAEKTITVVAPAIDTAPPTEINRRGTLDLNKYILSTVQPFGWKTSNKKIAAVSENGLLLMKKSGTVKITVTFPSEKGMTAKKLTIKLKIKMPQFKKTTYTVKTGKTVKTAVKNAEAKDISYRIEDTAIARVDPTGSVTGVSKGTTKLIMTVKGIDYETKIKVK